MIVSNYTVERRGYGRFAVQNRETHNMFFIESWQYDEWQDRKDEDCGHLETTAESEEYLASIEATKPSMM